MSAWGDILPGGPDGPGDEPWARTSDRNVWRALGGMLGETLSRLPCKPLPTFLRVRAPVPSRSNTS